jgi:predicted phage terminase large subunit-like protein
MIKIPDPSEVSEADLIEAEAHLGRSDLYYFTQNIIRIGEGSSFVRPREEVEPITQWLQKPWPADLDKKGRWKRFLALPRGTAKTSLVQAYSAWRVVKDPNLAVLFTSEEKALGLDSVAQIMEYLSGPRIESRYGKFKGESGWQRGKFTVSQRTTPRKEPTMMAGGVDVSSQGRHYDLIIADDLQGLTNNTPEGIAKVKEYLRLLWPILNPGGELIWICTRWDFEDVAGDILHEISQDSNSWDHLGDRGFFGCNAWIGDDDVFPEAKLNTPLFPSILPEDELNRLKQTMSPYHFSCQYENHPLPSTNAYFKLTDFQRVSEYDPDNPIFQGLTFYMGVDPASGTSGVRKGDDTAIVVIGVKGDRSQRSIYVVDAVGGQWKPKQMMSTIQVLYEKWRPRRIALETTGPGKFFYAMMQDWMKSEMVHLPIKEVTHAGTTETKADRIARMEPLYRSHSVFHVQNLKSSKLEMQLMRFLPGGATHDDYPDALAMAIEIVKDGHLVRRKARTRPSGLTYAPRYPSTGY